MSKQRTPKRSTLTMLALASWFATMTVVMSSLMARHLVALPAPEPNSALISALGALRPEHAQGWSLIHVIYGPCPCSGRIVDHLLERRAQPGITEHVLLTQDEGRFGPRLSQRGFIVHHLSPDELDARFKISSSPLLLILDPTDQPRYIGGYTAQKQGPAPQDLLLLARAQAGLGMPSLPILGCAVSARLRRLLNPMNLR